MDPAFMRILILAGTTEASALAQLVARDPRFQATLSLAGRTTSPVPQPLPVRVGGFGGADGLADWLGRQRIDAVVDATHPYAVQISAGAVEACGRLGLPLATVIRPAWTRQAGDLWTEVDSAGEAAGLLATETQPCRVFLSLGRQDLGHFARAPQHDYLARLIEPAGCSVLPPHIRFVFERGPFDKAAEARLLDASRIEQIVSKNSGGAATYAKIEAAREAGVRVILVKRPEKRHCTILHSPGEAAAWLTTIADHGPIPSSRRAV
jgi:precorrin-6A/cobalt-precorrin-6A reductase